jgi:hypothetical protein
MNLRGHVHTQPVLTQRAIFPGEHIEIFDTNPTAMLCICELLMYVTILLCYACIYYIWLYVAEILFFLYYLANCLYEFSSL